jgi:hypothetical protein
MSNLGDHYDIYWEFRNGPPPEPTLAPLFEDIDYTVDGDSITLTKPLMKRVALVAISRVSGLKFTVPAMSSTKFRITQEDVETRLARMNHD